MNIHHLELFYYVAKFGGINEAVRNIPYGIQQPAVSSQIIQLEETLGLSLFQRRPFALTAAGEELFNFIQPFFDNLGATADRLRGGVSQHIRIGASEIVLRDYLPEVLEEVRKKFTKLKLTLREGYQPQLESWLQKGELDLALTVLDQKPPTGSHSVVLFEMPLVLLVSKRNKTKSADELFSRDKIEESLISLPPHETITKVFQQHLARRGIDWFPGIEVSSINLVEQYAARGYGIGLSLEIPRRRPTADIRVLPLTDFPSVRFGVLWQGKLSPIHSTFLETIQQIARKLAEARTAASTGGAPTGVAPVAAQK